MTTYINADDGIVSGVAGLKYGADNSGSLVLQTNGTTAITISASQVVTFTNPVSFATASFTNLEYTGTLTGGTGVVNLGSGQFYKDASGNVGVGTASPSEKLQIRGSTDTFAFIDSTGATSKVGISVGNGGSTYGQLYFDNTNNNVSLLQKYSSGSLVLGTNSTERMRIDSSGNVGIGTTTMPSQFNLYSATGTTNGMSWSAAGWPYFVRAGMHGASGGDYYLSGNWTGSAVDNASYGTSYVNLSVGGAVVFGTGAANVTPTAKMAIDSSGNVGIGTASPDSKLHVLDSAGNSIRVGYSSGVNNFNLYDASSHIFRNAGGTAEYARINASGSVLVGTTSSIANIDQASGTGIALYSTSGNTQLLVSNNSDTTSQFNRQGTDGAVLVFRKAGAQVGYIDVTSTGVTYIGTNGVKFTATQTASADANTLDDYEEGTWTPTNPDGVTFTASAADYVKIGNTVYLNTFIDVGSNSNGSSVLVTGLPFYRSGQSSSVGCFNNNNEDLYAYMDTAGVKIRTNGNASKTYAQLSGKFIAFQIYYKV